MTNHMIIYHEGRRDVLQVLSAWVESQYLRDLPIDAKTMQKRIQFLLKEEIRHLSNYGEKEPQ